MRARGRGIWVQLPLSAPLILGDLFGGEGGQHGSLNSGDGLLTAFLLLCKGLEGMKSAYKSWLSGLWELL